ncbi:unnamed protein product [Auanema sp. JU1783]|nr:unnamed protein product [Auanema sp. JU1783]
MILVMSCCIRFAIRGCGGGGNRQSFDDYHSQYYVGSGQHYTSGRLYLDENNRVRSVMIATRVHDGDDSCPQIMGTLIFIFFFYFKQNTKLIKNL